MSFTIQWAPALNRTERRWLQCWLDRLAEQCPPGLVERRPGAITVRGGSPETVRSFAALTMAVIGRPRVAYTLAEAGPHAQTRAAA